MAAGVPMDEHFVFKVSLILLCFLSLLLMLVMFLIFWLGKIHHRVESISKGWNAYCILAAREETVPVSENPLPEVENTCSLPLVIFNQQAVDSETNCDWKNMDRGFAYGPIHSDEDEPSCPNLEETASMSQGEDRTSVEGEVRTSVDGEDRISVDGPKTQEQTIPDIPVASQSYLQIVDDNSTIVAISSSKHPAKDKKDQVKGRIYITLSSPEDADLDEALEDSADPMHGNNNICGKNEANERQVNSKKNHISEGAKKSSVDNPECVVLIDKNKEPESAEFYTEVPNLMNSQGDEQRNIRTSQEVVKNKANGEIIQKLPNENDHGCTVIPKESSAGTEKVIPRHGDESERVFPIQRPKVKRRRKKKRSTGIHSDGKNNTDERMSPQDNVYTQPSQPVDKLDKTGLDNVTDFQQSKSRGISKNEDKDDDEYQIVNYAEQFANKADTNVPVTPEYHAAGISENGREMKPVEGDQDKYIYDYAAPQGVTDWRSSDIVSQLRQYLQEGLRETQRVNRVNKSTTGPEVTESSSEDTHLTVVQGNEAHARYASQENHPATTTEQERQNKTTEPIYANINDINDNYCQTHADDAHPEVTYVNQGNIQNVRDEHSDSFPIYANIREVLHGSAMCNGNSTLRNEYRFPIYDNNDVIDV